MTPRTLSLVGITLFLAICNFSAQYRESKVGRGDEWLGWTSEQRNSYVYGFIDGWLGGTLTSCNLADTLFETGKSHTLGDGDHSTDMPSTRCLAHRGEFSRLFSERKFDQHGRLDVSIYTTVLTSFYEKHTRCREYPYGKLLELLSSKYFSADELYDGIKNGGIKQGRSKEWCGLDINSPY